MTTPEARGAGGSTPSVEQTVAGPLITLGHADRSGTRFSLGGGRGGKGVVVNLESGSSWHHVGARGPSNGYRLLVTPGTIAIDDATALLVCQPDGECFVGAVAGQVEVSPRAASPVVVGTDQVAWMAPAGDACLVFDDIELDELEDETWISVNLDLDRSAAPAGLPGPATAGADRQLGAFRAVPGADGATMALPEPDRPAGRRVLAGAVPWCLIVLAVLAPVLAALGASGRL